MRTDRRTDGQTDMAKLIVAFRSLTKAPKCIKFHVFLLPRSSEALQRADLNIQIQKR